MNKITKAFNFPEEILSKYEIIQEMGRGAFSTVYKIKSKSDNTIYCLKKINIKKTPDRKNEVNILSKLNHPNLVKYISSYEDEEGIYIIMEFCIYGDLYSLLHIVKKKKVYVNEEIIWDIAYQCLLGLEYLHSNQIIHRDIKLLNIFMSKNKIVKIGDMGMSKILDKKEMKLSRVGTPLFLAPELIKKEKYDFKADIWSLGCSIYHLAKTIPPFNDENLVKLGQAIINDNPPKLPECYSEELGNFINKLMTKNKKHRPTAAEALELIPSKIKDKFENENNLNKKNINNNKILKNNMNINANNKDKNDKKNISHSEQINQKKNDENKIILDGQKSLNKQSNLKGSNNELISGQTFYKFFRKNSGKTDRKHKTSILGLNKGYNISSSTFDTKNMNSILIMSKTMGGTKEGFFRHNNKNISRINPSSIKEEIIIKKEEQKEPYNNSNTNNTILKSGYKPKIIETENKKENDKNNINIIEENKEKYNKNKINNINNDINEYNNKENNLNKGFNFSNRYNSNKENKKFYNIFNKNKTKTKFNFVNYNGYGLYKNYRKENVKNKNFDSDGPIKFPIIGTNIVSKNINIFNNNFFINNKIEQSFRKTANSFNFNNKLTIHDLK
jgi:NIMA (never in mitosis gene a)-related kinase